MKTLVTNYDRQDLFDFYNQKTNPFINMTVKIDITNIINYCKSHRYHYATIAYFIYLAVNEIDNFKYRSENGKIYKCDSLGVNFTQTTCDGKVGFFLCKATDSYNEFIDEYKIKQKDFLEKPQKINSGNSVSEIWMSCIPWTGFTSLATPFDKEITIPQFIWGKFFEENNRTYTNLMIMVHHGFMDGRHLGKFLSILEEKINQFDRIIS